MLKEQYFFEIKNARPFFHCLRLSINFVYFSFKQTFIIKKHRYGPRKENKNEALLNVPRLKSLFVVFMLFLAPPSPSGMGFV